MASAQKKLVILRGEIKTPPFSKAARVEAGTLLRKLQDGELPGMPHARPMPSIGVRCYELRVRDETKNWRIIVRLDDDAIVIAEIFAKTTRTMPKNLIANCQRRLRLYDQTLKKLKEQDKEK
jgi:phage-related protein